jgi:hypothetical protein
MSGELVVTRDQARRNRLIAMAAGAITVIAIVFGFAGDVLGLPWHWMRPAAELLLLAELVDPCKNFLACHPEPASSASRVEGPTRSVFSSFLGFRSNHSGLSPSINLIFLALRHPLSCFSRDGVAHVFVRLEIDEAFEMMHLRETGNETCLMLSDPPGEIVDQPDIQHLRFDMT